MYPSGPVSCKTCLQAASAEQTCSDSDVPGTKNLLSRVRSIGEHLCSLVAVFRRARADATLLSVMAGWLLLSGAAACMHPSAIPCAGVQRPVLNCRCGGAVAARPCEVPVLQFQLPPAFTLRPALPGVHEVVALQAIICIVCFVARARHV